LITLGMIAYCLCCNKEMAGRSNLLIIMIIYLKRMLTYHPGIDLNLIHDLVGEFK